MSITLEEHFLSRAAHSSELAKDDPIHGFPTGIINKLVDIDNERIRSMDENNVAIQVLSHTPTNFLTAATIIALNDELATAIQSNKCRFAGFACLSMDDPVAATNELERCIKQHGFVGALIDNHSNGNFYDGREYDILWAKAVELDVPIYIHPAWPSQKLKEALYSGGNLQSDSNSATALGAFAFGWHASTANTILRLMASNTFDRHPNLKIIIGHSGELIPYMFDRINKATAFFGMKRGFVEVMHNNIWITTSGMFDVHSLRCLLGNMPLSQVMFSVDYPFSDNKLGKEYLETIRNEEILDEDEIEAFASGNARRLLFHQGPVKALNPTKRYLIADKKTPNAESDAGKESRPSAESPGVAYVWRSRDNRKGRHALAISVDPHKHEATKGPRPSNSYHQTLRGILKMFVRYPVWDVSYDVAVVFTIGSIIWVINGYYSFLPVLYPSTKVSDWAGGLTAFIGATVFEFGSFLLMLEAVNENRSDCFGWAVEESVDGMLHLTHAHNCKHAHAQKGTLVKQSSRSLGNNVADSSGKDRMWSWWPTWYELRTHYFFDIGFLACSSQTFGATVFWISGFTALPPILNGLSTPAENGVYWLPQVIGGTGFIVSSLLFMVEVQPRWYMPAPGVLGWHIGLWNLIGAIGFTLCGALGFGITHPGVEYALTLSTFIGSWAFLFASPLDLIIISSAEMSDTDTYCAICGVPAHDIDIESYDESKVSDNSLEWLEEVNILGRPNKRASPPRPVTFTGPGDYSHYNWYILRSQSQNNPLYDRHMHGEVRVYDWAEHHDVLIPFHMHCYEILKKVAAPHDIEPDVIYETSRPHCAAPDALGLDFDYGDAKACQGQTWEEIDGTEYVLASPTKIPRVKDFFKRILAESQLEEPAVSGSTYAQGDGASKDALESLPGELMSSVLQCLDFESLCSIRLASRNAVKETTSNAFWKNRVISEMPWIVDFFPGKRDTEDPQIDWFKVYKALRSISQGQDQRQPFTTGGLRNRSRKQEKKNWPTEQWFLKKQDILKYPYNKNLVWSKASLTETFLDMTSAEHVIEVFWTADGEFAGIGCSTNAEGKMRTVGSKNIFATSDKVPIGKDDWITELIITSQDELDGISDLNSLDNASLNAVVGKVVGLQFIFSKGDPVQVAGWVVGEPISKLCLLFQPFKKALQECLSRLKPREYLDESGNPVPFNDPEASVHLWKNDLPPRELQVLPARHGMINSDITRGDRIMESLIFGTTKDDLSKITAVGVDAQFRGFEVCFSNGESRTIGHTNAMQSFPIDSAGGERILYQAPGHRRDVLMGIYCHWGNRHTLGTDFIFIGGFSRKFDRLVDKTPLRAMDAHEQHFWTPDAPPQGVLAVGNIYGYREFRLPPSNVVHKVPSEDAVVSWFDCSRPIASIKVAFCHSSDNNQIPLVAITFRYADDQTTKSIGPTKFTAPKDNRNHGGHYWCWCADVQREQPELEEKPHYTEDEWDVQGSHLKFLQLWIDEQLTLSGLQFIAKDGRESPAWGSCVGEKPVRLPLQAQKKNRAAGLKFFVDEMGRGVTRDDFVVVGVQLIGFSKE
ncbi:5-carboxyvanillate decarboxylase [Fusarium tjaetaba]|uniref:5-carboxyvanillate decarboxylase n=1 Tax=Fusarium tjaetaba TaxID=1567544 RepID=A0A8H5QUK9_9HYPO|nr:5-carboxyvanillate decarboxylase [Fusarium tjaetaba]KAF5621164.1 5-carboxyvanillate decarboxylase [Fusarium tjaetaba]